MDHQPSRSLFQGGQIDPQEAAFLKQFIKKNSSSSSSVSATGRSHNGLSSLVLNNTSETSLAFTTNDFANGITWGSNKFTIVTAGRYLVTCTVRLTTVTANAEVRVLIYKNGSKVTTGSQAMGNTANGMSPSATDLIDCAVGDYIEFYAVKDVGAAISIDTSIHATFGALALQ